MGRREASAIPFLAQRAAAQRARQEFSVIRLEIHALMQEARALREEARGIDEGPHDFGDALRRRSRLHAQALLCSTEALELLRESCLRTRSILHRD